MAKHVFLSYSRQDYSLVRQMIQRLSAEGLTVWHDQESIRGGEHWQEKIVSAIENCDVFIIALSPSSVQSKYVRKELELAERANTRIIPIELSNVSIPQGMVFPLVGLHHIEFHRDYEIGISKLVSAIFEGVVSGEVYLPEKIIPFSFSTQQVVEKIAETLIDGIRTPLNIFEHAKFQLRQVYVPAYVFNGTFLVDWSAEVETVKKKVFGEDQKMISPITGIWSGKYADVISLASNVSAKPYNGVHEEDLNSFIEDIDDLPRMLQAARSYKPDGVTVIPFHRGTNETYHFRNVKVQVNKFIRQRIRSHVQKRVNGELKGVIRFVPEEITQHVVNKIYIPVWFVTLSFQENLGHMVFRGYPSSRFLVIGVPGDNQYSWMVAGIVVITSALMILVFYLVSSFINLGVLNCLLPLIPLAGGIYFGRNLWDFVRQQKINNYNQHRISCFELVRDDHSIEKISGKARLSVFSPPEVDFRRLKFWGASAGERRSVPEPLTIKLRVGLITGLLGIVPQIFAFENSESILSFFVFGLSFLFGLIAGFAASIRMRKLHSWNNSSSWETGSVTGLIASLPPQFALYLYIVLQMPPKEVTFLSTAILCMGMPFFVMPMYWIAGGMGGLISRIKKG